MKKVVLVLLLIGGSVAVGAAMAWHRGNTIRNEALKNAEAAALEIKEYKAAAEVTATDIQARISNEIDLKSQIDALKKDVEEASGGNTTVIEITGWETDIIEIPVDNFYVNEVETLVEAECTDCVRKFISDLPPFKFAVDGVTAQVETELGNHFVVGTVSLKDARVLGQETVLGTADFRRDVTDIMKLEEKETKRSLRHRIAVTKLSDQFDWSLKYEFQFSRRFAAVAGVIDGEKNCYGCGGTIYEYGLSFGF